MKFVGATDLGQVRLGNEDAYGFDAGRRVAVLADGMGGLNAGEVASAAAVRAFLEAVPDQCDGVALKKAAMEANRKVFEMSRDNAALGTMGTTLVGCAAAEGAVDDATSDLPIWLFVHIGDSRAYLLRDGQLERVTRDHSVVQEMLDHGLLSEFEARRAPNRHIITRAIGLEAQVIADIIELPRQSNDLILLCSDGLTDMVIESDISAILTDIESPDVAAEQLIAAANRAGGNDNISVVLIR
ncbi:MAG: protein phosphatase 2C domain-containing protein [Pseudomonadales bacterium]